jgi:threonylcarbamoyladenosine tRNA methylthiotransferase MtaB
LSVEVHTLGCRLNIAESETLRAMLADEHDLVVINSCAVTNEAVRQTRRAIRRARAARPNARVLLTGCAAEVERESLREMPELDGFVANAAKLDPRSWNARQAARPTASKHTRAFIQVQNGCDHACTFCIIPQGRGPSRSRAAAAVIAEVERYLAEGVREVVLTGVDLTDWGAGLPGEPRLGLLVSAILNSCPTLERLRLSSLDGIEIDPALLELLASEPRVMPHLHLSLQSGDDLVLKRMKRRHSRSDVLRLVEGLRARRPDIAIGADLIAGFPTEDEAMHANNLSIIGELGIVHGHVFPYSRRSATPAARMPQVTAETIKRRAAELRQAVAEERRRWLAGLIAVPLKVLAERDGTGHAENFARVRLPEGAVAGSVIGITPTHVVEGLLA